MIEALVRAHLPVAPVYATPDVVMTLQGEGQALSDCLRAAFQIVPQGLVFRLFADREVHRPALAPLRTRGLWDAPTAVREDEVVRQKILPVYVTMLVNAGRAFAVQGDGEQAMEAYRQAYRIDFSGALIDKLLPPGILLQLR